MTLYVEYSMWSLEVVHVKIPQYYLGVFSDSRPRPMGASFLPVLLFTAIWAVVGIVLPFFVPRGPHKSVIQVTDLRYWWECVQLTDLLQVVLMITGACCWLFWLCCYMSQMNPLIGPVLETKALYAMKLQWGGGDDWNIDQIPLIFP